MIVTTYFSAHGINAYRKQAVCVVLFMTNRSTYFWFGLDNSTLLQVKPLCFLFYLLSHIIDDSTFCPEMTENFALK